MATDEFGSYARLEKRQALFRVLASSVVRELRGSGYEGTDLLGFVGHLMDAISSEAFEGRPNDEPARKTKSHVDARAAGIELRAPEPADCIAFERWRTDPLIHASLAPVMLDELLEAGQGARHQEYFVICDAESTAPIGVVALRNIELDAGQAELSKLIGEARFRGRGLAAAATHAVLDHAFGPLALNRVYLRTLGGNLRNIRLNEALGFRFEGVLREAARVEGRLADVVLMALLRRQFFEDDR